MSSDFLVPGLGLLGDIVGAGVGLATAKMNMDLQRETNAQNYDIAIKNLGFQREQYDYQKSLNALTMEREDNATQRKMVDLIQSGLSPILASGSGASSATFSSAPAPQINYRKQAPQFDLNGLLQLSMLGSQIENLKANTDKTKAETENISGRTGIALAQEERDKAMHDVELRKGEAEVLRINNTAAMLFSKIQTEDTLRESTLQKIQADVVSTMKKVDLDEANLLYRQLEYSLLDKYGDTEQNAGIIDKFFNPILKALGILAKVAI